jgi:single-stranded DNA-binding protein
MSSIDCAFFGFLAADAEARTSKAGKPWARIRVGVGKDSDIQWLTVSVFGKAAELASGLRKGDRIYCEGTIRLDEWSGNDGVKRHSLAVASFKVDRTHNIGRNKLKRERTDSEPQRQIASAPDDPIPF